MNDESVSAVPGDLIDYSIRAQEINGWIANQAAQLEPALMAFIRSAPSPKYISHVARLDLVVAGLPKHAAPIDDLVGQVGEAFRTLDQRQANWDGRHMGERENPLTMNNSWAAAQIAELLKNGAPERALAEDAAAYHAREQHDLGKANGQLMKDAWTAYYKNGDTSRIKALIDELKAQSGNADYMAGYYAALGPDVVRGIAAQILYNDPPRLQVWDEGLAAATTSSLWDTTFNSQLFRRFDTSVLNTADQPAAQRRYEYLCADNTLLLKYGKFSEDYLRKATDQIVMARIDEESYIRPPTVMDISKYQPEFDIVLGALSRNGEAGASILGDKFVQDFRGHLSDQSRIQEILHYEKWYWDSGANPGPQLNDAIKAAGTSSNQYDRMHFLQQIGEHDWTDVPPGVREGIATSIAYNIGDPAFVQDERMARNQDPAKVTWQDRLFMAAELNANGSANEANVSLLTQAFQHWAETHPIPNLPADLNEYLNNSDALAQWGTLMALLTASGREGPHFSAVQAQKFRDFIDNRISDVFGYFISGRLLTVVLKNKYIDKQLVKSIVSRWFADAKGSVKGALYPPDDLAASDAELWKENTAMLRVMIATQQVTDDSSLLPADLRGKGIDDPAVRAYVQRLAASETTSDLTASYSLDRHTLARVQQIIEMEGAARDQVTKIFLSKHAK